MMFWVISSTDDPLLWNQSFGFEEALISCSEEVLMRPDQSKLENRPVKQADGNFTRYVLASMGRKTLCEQFSWYLNHGIKLTPDNVCYISNFFAVNKSPYFDNLFFVDVTTDTWRPHPIRLQVTTVITLPSTNISRVPYRFIQPQAKLSVQGTRINQVCYSDRKCYKTRTWIFSLHITIRTGYCIGILPCRQVKLWNWREKLRQARRCSNQSE